MKIRCPNCKKKFDCDNLEDVYEYWRDRFLTDMDNYVHRCRLDDLKKPIRKSRGQFG